MKEIDLRAAAKLIVDSVCDLTPDVQVEFVRFVHRSAEEHGFTMPTYDVDGPREEPDVESFDVNVKPRRKCASRVSSGRST